MKKFDIKKLLLLMLAMLMVFALVACNNNAGEQGGDEEEPAPTPSTLDAKYIKPDAYFQALWNAAATLGAIDEPKATDDLGVELDLDLKLAFGDDAIDVGIALSIVLDRAASEADAKEGLYSAAKVKLYDKATGDNWLAIYFFVEDPSNVYLSFKDQNVKIPFDTDGEGNGTYQSAISGFIADNQILGGKTINDLLNAIVEKGEDDKWTVDDLLNVVLGLLGMDLSEVIDLVNGLKIVTLSEDETSLLPVLEELGGALFPFDKKSTSTERVATADGKGYTYTGTVNSGLFELVAGFIDGAAISNDELLTADTTIQLIFTTEETAAGITGIDGFKIRALFPELKGGDKDVELVIGINDVVISNLGNIDESATTSDIIFAGTELEKDDFSDEFNLNITLNAGIDNGLLVINPSDKIECEGYLTLQLDGIVDLKGTGTNAYATLGYSATKTGTKAIVAKASYAPMAGDLSNYGELILEVDDTVMVGDENAKSIVEMFVKNLGPMIVAGLANAEKADSYTDKTQYKEAADDDEGDRYTYTLGEWVADENGKYVVDDSRDGEVDENEKVMVADTLLQDAGLYLFQTMFVGSAEISNPIEVVNAYAAMTAAEDGFVGGYAETVYDDAEIDYFVKGENGEYIAVSDEYAAETERDLYKKIIVDADTITAAKALFAYNENFKGVVLQKIDLNGLFRGLFVKEALSPTALDSALNTFKTWNVGLGGTVATIADAVSIDDNGVIAISVDNLGNTISGIFTNVSTSEMLFGKEPTAKADGVDGWFGNDESAGKAGGWWNTFFAGSSWVEEDEKDTITNLFESGAKISIANSGEEKAETGKIAIEVTNGGKKLSLDLLINVTDEAKEYTQITNVAATHLGDAEQDGKKTVAEGAQAGDWCILTVAQ